MKYRKKEIEKVCELGDKEPKKAVKKQSFLEFVPAIITIIVVIFLILTEGSTQESKIFYISIIVVIVLIAILGYFLYRGKEKYKIKGDFYGFFFILTMLMVILSILDSIFDNFGIGVGLIVVSVLWFVLLVRYSYEIYQRAKQSLKS